MIEPGCVAAGPMGELAEQLHHRRIDLARLVDDGSWPECSNQTNLFDGAVSASK